MTRTRTLVGEGEPFTFVLDGVLPMSWNQLNRSIDRFSRSNAVKSVHKAVERAWVAVSPKPPLYDVPVAVTCTAYFGKGQRRYDCDNLTVKSLLDPLKGVLIVNDSRDYVPSVTLISLRDNDRPRTELAFVPVPPTPRRPKTNKEK